ncbi:hypothetical protein EDC04DRAFT_557866 [Pisolithus marmoratus]|nr:hypothetical protein EDC04DRAFT_557866 [Pisolithus marmoratus]
MPDTYYQSHQKGLRSRTWYILTPDFNLNSPAPTCEHTRRCPLTYELRSNLKEVPHRWPRMVAAQLRARSPLWTCYPNLCQFGSSEWCNNTKVDPERTCSSGDISLTPCLSRRFAKTCIHCAVRSQASWVHRCLTPSFAGPKSLIPNWARSFFYIRLSDCRYSEVRSNSTSPPARILRFRPRMNIGSASDDPSILSSGSVWSYEYKVAVSFILTSITNGD